MAEDTLTDEQIADKAFDVEAAIEAVVPSKPDPAAAPEPKPAAAKPDAKKPDPAPKPDKPEYVQITRKDWEEVRAAAARTASYDGQFSRAFGTLGGLQKTLDGLKATPRGGKLVVPKEALADMERDFPEFAAYFRKALEASSTGTSGAADVDPDLVRRLVNEHAAEGRTSAELEDLVEEHPDWKRIVGQISVDHGEKPDPKNAFRAWLATQKPEYQQRLNETHRPAVISRAIDRFQSATRAAAKPAVATLDAQLAAARRGRIAGAVQPKGDGGGPVAPGNDEDAGFASGFASG